MSDPKSNPSSHHSVVINAPNDDETLEVGYHISPPQNRTLSTICAPGCFATLFSGLTSAAAAASGAAGAGILNAAGYTKYSIKPAATAGAAGGSLIAIPMIILLLCYRKIFDGNSEEKINMMEQFALSAAISAL